MTFARVWNRRTFAGSIGTVLRSIGDSSIKNLRLVRAVLLWDDGLTRYTLLPEPSSRAETGSAAIPAVCSPLSSQISK